LRTSSYVVYVDLPDDRERWLLFHSYLGVYDLVSRRVAGFLRSQESIPVPKPLYGDWEPDQLDADQRWTPSESTIATLIRRGYLTEKSHDEEVESFSRFVASLHDRQRRSSPNYVIMPTYNCNLRCHYCFQDQMRTNAALSHLLGTMTIEMADRIMNSFWFIEEQLHTAPHEQRPKRSFTFFGGEPLLASSRPVVEHIIRKQREVAQPAFSAITNATDLDAYRDLLGPTGIRQVQITIDGPPTEHDRRRIYPDKSGSFAKIARNIDLALDRGTNVSVRVNVDRGNVTSLPALAKEFLDRGWGSRNAFGAYLAPIRDYSGLQNAGTRGDFFNHWELGDALDALHRTEPATKIFSRVDGGLRERVRPVFETGAVVGPRATYCGAHNSMYVFDSFGDIYACWDRTGDRNLRIGMVNEDSTVTLNGVADMWRSRTVASNPTCRQCRYAVHCGGGCAVLAEVSSGTIFSNFCDAFGKRFRAAVAEAFLESHGNRKLAEASVEDPKPDELQPQPA
jgi:uncharacterized protein